MQENYYDESAKHEVAPDPLLDEEFERQQKEADMAEKYDAALTEANQQADQAAAQKKAEEEANKPDSLGQIVAAPVVGVGDTIADLMGFIPALQPLKENWYKWFPEQEGKWSETIRDISGVVIPTLAGGLGIARGGMAAASKLGMASKVSNMGKWSKLGAEVAASAGVDVAVSAIDADTAKAGNFGNLLEAALGEGTVPWANRASDDPDVIRRVNILENMGFGVVATGLLGMFAKGKGARTVMKGVDEAGVAYVASKQADNIVNSLDDAELKQVEDLLIAEGEAAGIDFLAIPPEDRHMAIARRAEQLGAADPEYGAVKGRDLDRDAQVSQRAMEDIANDPDGANHSHFANEPHEFQQRAVPAVDVDPKQTALQHAVIQRNDYTVNGRAAPMMTESFMKKYLNATTDEQIELANEISSRLAPSIEATRGAQKYTEKDLKNGMSALAVSAFRMNPDEFAALIDTLKKNTIDGRQYLDQIGFQTGAAVVKEGYLALLDPDMIRLKAMMTQQTADTVTDTAVGVRAFDGAVDTSRQQELIMENLQLLNSEVRASQYIRGWQLQAAKLDYKNPQAVVEHLKKLEEVKESIDLARANAKKFNDEFKLMRQENPSFAEALVKAYDVTNGSVDQIHKMHRYAENSLGIIRKAFIDNEPEVPSLVVQGMQTARINSVLSGLSAVRAATGNAVLMIAKPVSMMAGSVLTADAKGFKRALVGFGGVSENLQRAYKVMGDEWKRAAGDPMYASRADYSRMEKTLEQFEVMESYIEGAKAKGEVGKVAAYNIANGLNWWNGQIWTRYGVAAMQAIDGFTGSMMASMTSRFRAYDDLFTKTKGVWNEDVAAEFQQVQQRLYGEAFDESGLLTDKYAKFATGEIAMNLDNELVNGLETIMRRVPAAKSLFMFPRTGLNALEMGWSFNPLSSIGPALTRARRVLGAQTQEEMLDALREHGIDEFSQTAFNALKSEYLGRQAMGATVVTGAGLWAINGKLTGSGPQDAAEAKRMMNLKWRPYSLMGPDGNWYSYQGFEPFDSLLGLVADAVYSADRVDQAFSEDIFRKISHSIGMNISNKTFLSGFEPLVSMLSGDEGAWNRFLAMQADSALPYAGVRSLLSRAIVPQLQDVQNDFASYMSNRNRFALPESETRQSYLDIYTGVPINQAADPLTAAVNAFLPYFKQSGGLEPFRQWILSTGWDGLQTPRTNPTTGNPLTPAERQWVNNWIAQNAGLKDQVENMMNAPDQFWDKQIKEYVRRRGQQTQKDFAIKDTIVHKELDQIHNKAFEQAWAAYEQENAINADIGSMKKFQKRQMSSGNLEGASTTAEQVQELLQIPR